MTDTVLVTFEEKVLPVGDPLKDGPSRAIRRSYEYPNGSAIVCGGLDMPERTFSSEYDTIVVFEAVEITENEWELLHRALRNGKMGWGHQAICDCNPGAPSHWINHRFNNPEFERILTRHTDNPLFYNEDTKEWTPAWEDYGATLRRLTGHRRMRLLEGKWSQAEGVVYPEFDRALHEIDPFPIPKDWPRIRAIDFGYINPFVCQWWAQGPDSEIYRYREIYHSRRIVADHAQQILAVETPGERHRIQATVCDHDAEDRATLKRAGIFPTAAKKTLRPGIDLVKDWLVPMQNDKVRIYFFKHCTLEEDPELLAAGLPTTSVVEFDTYIEDNRAGRRSGGAPTEDPLDKDNHGMDTMRYAVQWFNKHAAGGGGRTARPKASRAGSEIGGTSPKKPRPQGRIVRKNFADRIYGMADSPIDSPY